MKVSCCRYIKVHLAITTESTRIDAHLCKGGKNVVHRGNRNAYFAFFVNIFDNLVNAGMPEVKHSLVYYKSLWGRFEFIAP